MRAYDYGWIIVLVVFLCQMLAIGGISYAFGLFIKPAADEFDASRTSINNILILWMAGMSLAGPGAGWLLDRIAARYVMAGGALMLGGGLATVSSASSPVVIGMTVLLLIGPGSAALGPLSAATLIARWFKGLRGRAMGVSAIAPAVGAFMLVPMLGLVINAYGWRTAILLEGLFIIALLCPLTLILVRSGPPPIRERSLSTPAPQFNSDAERTWRLRELLRLHDFWFIALAVGIMFGTGQALLAALIPRATDQGFSTAQAGALISVLSAATILGKLFFGALADRCDKRRLFASAAALAAGFFISLAIDLPYAVLLSVVFVGGFAQGGTLPLWGAILAERFGARSYGTAMGCMMPIHLPLGILAIRSVGEISDQTGSYDIAFVCFAIAAIASAALILLVKQPYST